MLDITTPMIIDDVARHLRTCAVLVADAPTVTFLLRCAHELDARAQELREDARAQQLKEPAINPGKKP